jgi:ribonucleoside-diphosphate reductase alpha chain
LIADFGEKVYAQAPFEKVETEDDIRKWNEIVSNYIPVDWSKLSEEDDFTEIQQTVECAGGACELK